MQIIIRCSPKSGAEFIYHLNQLSNASEVHSEQTVYPVQTVDADETLGLLGHYYSPEKLSELLSELTGGHSYIPALEVYRLRNKLPKILTLEQKAEIKKLTDVTEDKAKPIIMQIPKVFMVNGKEVPFTISAFKEAWDQAKDAGNVSLGQYISSYVPKTRSDEHTWEDGLLRAYTSRCLDGSKDKKYNEQIEHQNNVLGEGHEVDESMFFATMFHYLATGERLLYTDFMRLNALGTDGDPLYVGSDGDDFDLRSSYSSAHSFGGVGASLGISS